MSSSTHICILCNKTFNSYEQLEAHKGAKKHKYRFEIAFKERINGKNPITFTNSNSIDEGIQI